MLNNDEFWDNIEKDEYKILKWNEKGDYSDQKLTSEQIRTLDSFQNTHNVSELKIGDVRNGKIIFLNKREIIIDVNYKDNIYVDINSKDIQLTQNLSIGDTIDVMVTSFKDNPFEIKGSITELIKIDVANKLRDYYKNKQSLEATVESIIPAGFMLSIEMNKIQLTAFMPNTLAGVNRLTPEQSQLLLGKKIPVMLETLQQEKGVYVVSRKKYLKSLIPDAISRLEKGKVYTGTVTGSKDFGVFIEFGVTPEEEKCLTGMIHKVNLNEDWHDKMDQILPGFEIDFYFQDALKGDRLILTQNINQESLWDTIKVNQVKKGKVINVKPFGVLISLDNQTMGLIQSTYINKSGKTLKKGDIVDVKVISVIKDDRKIYLSFPEL
jgi:ribosomal protein S1